jgi:type VI secretion system protein ImpB
MPESTQKKLSRIRPPRVQITYDVEIGDAIQMKELPFVAGILADLSGKPAAALPKLKDRKFVEIDRDNFNDVLKSIGPTLTIKGKALEFKKIDDFRPESIVTQVEDLKQLLDTRQALNDLLAKLDGNDSLNAQLRRVVESPENQTKLLEVVKVTEEKKEAEGGN